MSKAAAPAQARESQQPAAAAQQSAGVRGTGLVFADNRREAEAQRELPGIEGNPRVAQQKALADQIAESPRVLRQKTFVESVRNSPGAAQRGQMDSPVAHVAQRRERDELTGEPETAQREDAAAWPNHTGLPDPLKAGVESLSGMSLDNVKVHYNSARPAQLSALACAQGSEIHLAPGQERHLPHEAWHVVQQAQGRVRPTTQMRVAVPANASAVTTLAGLSPPHVVQGKLIELATKENLRGLLGNEDAQKMLDEVGTWPNSAQERILLNEKKDGLRSPGDLTKELEMLYAAWSRLPRTDNYRSFFMMPVEGDQSSAGKELAQSIVRNLISLIPVAKKGNFNRGVTNLDAKPVADAIPDDLGEGQLAEALRANITSKEKSLTAMGTAPEHAKESVKAKAEIVKPIVTPRSEELKELLSQTDLTDDLKTLARRKKNLADARESYKSAAEAVEQAIGAGGSYERFRMLLDDRTFWQNAVWKWEERVKDAESPIAEKNKRMLKNLGEGAGSLSPRVTDFMKNYSVGEVSESSGAPVTDVSDAVVETKPDRFTKEPPKDPATTGYTVNIMTVASGDDTTPGKIADQYYSESFDEGDFGDEGKKAGIPYRMSMVVGVNLYQSIQSEKAESTVREYVKKGGQESRYAMAAHGFVWSPVWQKAGKEVAIKDLRNEFDNMNPAEKKVALEYESRSVRSKIQAHIPYGRLRNQVAQSSHTRDQVAFLGKHNKVVYIQSGDDDSPSLRPEGIEVDKSRGVFSRYDKVLSQLGRHPLLVVGGYRFDLGTAKRQLDKNDPGDFLTYLADVLNQAIRKSLGEGLAVYPTEPNLLIKAFESGKALELPKNMWGVGAAEGRHLRKNLLNALTDKSPEAVRKAVVFDPRAAVATDPTRFKLGNEIKVPEKHYAMQDPQKYKNFEEMRLARGGKDKKNFMAQILADVVLQNQSMTDRRVFAREVGDLLKLGKLNAGDAQILLENPNSGELAESELIAVMIHNNAIQQKVFELSGIGGGPGTEFSDFTKRMRFDINKEEPMDKLHSVEPKSVTLPNTQKLQVDMANQVGKIVENAIKDLGDLKVDGESFWTRLYETMDRMYLAIPEKSRT